MQRHHSLLCGVTGTALPRLGEDAKAAQAERDSRWEGGGGGWCPLFIASGVMSRVL